MNRNLVIAMTVVAVAAAGGFLIQRSLSDRGTTLKPAPEQSALNVPSAEPGTPPVDAQTSATKRAIPETLPEITLEGRDGAPRSLSEWKGRPVIVNFWATWCGPCRDEIPLLQSLRREHSADGLEVIGIAIDEREAVLKYAGEMGIEYPILMGEQDGYEAAEAFGVALVLPFSVFVDKQGRIVTLKVGELHADEATFILDRVRDADAGRLPLDGARQQIADRLRDLAGERARAAAG